MRIAQSGAQIMNWFSVACELHRDWRNDIEGLGNILSNFIPNYRNIMNSYLAQQKLMKWWCFKYSDPLIFSVILAAPSVGHTRQ